MGSWTPPIRCCASSSPSGTGPRGRTPGKSCRRTTTRRCHPFRAPCTTSPNTRFVGNQGDTLTHRIALPLALLLALAGCRDVAAPLNQQNAAGPLAARQVASDPTWPPELHVLQQSPTAPRLRTYQVSFWARRGTQTTLFVNYRPAPGQGRGDPFLRFKIPINGMVAGADGVPLDRGDSVLITLTIDSVSFLVDFQPSGVLFSKSSPAQLAIWYQDANPDLNGDGVVDATDEALKQQLAIWTESTKSAWKQLSSRNDTTQQYVAAELYHFSSYALSW